MGDRISTLSKGGIDIRKCLLNTDETVDYALTQTQTEFKIYNPREKQLVSVEAI